MANFAYQAKDIIGGVSTRPYALREDGHAITQENCYLSTKFGLAKRPGLTYLQTHSSVNASADFVRFSLYNDDKERLIIGTGAADWQVYGPDGKKYPVSHFPSSADSSVSATRSYVNNGAMFTATSTSTTTMGDVTWIADSNVVPEMKETVWEGYTDTGIMNPDGTEAYGEGTVSVGNDDVFTVTVDSVHWADATWYTSVNVSEEINGSVTNYRIHQGHGADGASWYWGSHKVGPRVREIATCLSYKLSGGTKHGTITNSDSIPPYTLTNNAGLRIVQAHNLNAATEDVTNDQWADHNTYPDLGSGSSTVVCRYVGIGSLASIGHGTMGGAVTMVGEVTTCFRTVPSLAVLPEQSFLDHTLEVSPEEAGTGFYMRFVSDDKIIKDQAINHRNIVNAGYHGDSASQREIKNTRAQFDKTSKLPRKGHWEEYCGTDVKQDIDGTTMPLLFVVRPDGSHALMEARGSFQVNTEEDDCTSDKDANTLTVQFDSGFSNDGLVSSTPLTAASIVRGDTIELSMISGPFGPELAPDTPYYVLSAVRQTSDSNVWILTLSLTKDGPILDITKDKANLPIVVKLTTYKNFAWTKREAGDDDSNPTPAFIGNAITSVFNYQNRLAFVNADTVTFSGTGDFFNTFRTTVRQLDESDPFEVSPNTDDGEVIKYAMSFEDDIILVSNLAQFKLSGNNGFSPSTATCAKASALTSDLFAQPVVVNNHVYLPYAQEESTGMYAIRNSKAVDRYEHHNITENIPGYLPRGARRIAGSSKHDMVFVLDDTDNSSMYVYSYADGPERRILSAWTKWTFGDTQIHDIIMMGDRLYCITDTNNMLCVQYIDLDITTSDTLLTGPLLDNFSNALLDNKCEYEGGSTPLTDETIGISSHPARRAIGGIYSISFANGNTTIDLKQRIHPDDAADYVCIVGAGASVARGTVIKRQTSGADHTLNVIPNGGAPLSYGINPVLQNMTRIIVYGIDLTSVDIYLGVGYTMTSTYGPFLPSVDNTPIAGRNVFVRSGRLTYSQANEFQIKVTQDKEYTQTVAAKGPAIDGTRSGDVMFAIRKDLPSLEYTVSNTSPWNALFQLMKYDLVVQEIAGG